MYGSISTSKIGPDVEPYGWYDLLPSLYQEPLFKGVEERNTTSIPSSVQGLAPLQVLRYALL